MRAKRISYNTRSRFPKRDGNFSKLRVVVQRLENQVPELFEDSNLTTKNWKRKEPAVKKKVNFENVEKTRSCLTPTRESGIQISSLVGPLKTGPSTMSRLPRTYNTFVQPITDNEWANSTLHDLTGDETIFKSIVSNDSGNDSVSRNLTKSPIFRPKTVTGRKCTPGPRMKLRKRTSSQTLIMLKDNFKRNTEDVALQTELDQDQKASPENGNAKRKRNRNFRTSNAHTQTEKQFHLSKVCVVLEKLEKLCPDLFTNQKEKTKPILKKVNFEDVDKPGTSEIMKPESGGEVSSVIGPLRSGPSGMSTLPTSYSIFVQPISNKKRANSTLQATNLSSDEATNKENEKPILKKVNFEDVQETTTQEPGGGVSSMIGPLLNGPSSMSRLPRSYGTFVHPITNKERPSSTLQNDKDTNLSSDETTNITPIARRTKFEFGCRSCPKSYKRECIENANFQIPVMLDAGDTLEMSLIGSELSTAEEPPEQEVTAHLDSSQFEFEEIRFNISAKEAAVQTDMNQNDQQTQVSPVETSHENNIRPIRLNFENLTTMIASRSHRRDEGNSSLSAPSGENESINDRSEDRARYINITAKTVYIHNHYYKN